MGGGAGVGDRVRGGIGTSSSWGASTPSAGSSGGGGGVERGGVRPPSEPPAPGRPDVRRPKYSTPVTTGSGSSSGSGIGFDPDDRERRRQERRRAELERRRAELQRRLAKRVVAVHAGRGRVAGTGFANPAWLDGRLFVYDDGSCGLIWSDGFLIDFERLAC